MKQEKIIKVLVLFSGGLDSTTALALAIEKYGKENVIALSVYYGQKHIKEIEAASKITEYYGVEHLKTDLTRIFSFSNSSLLQGSDEKIPEGSYDSQEEISTYVPFRNGLFLSVAASIAQSRNCEIIYYGAHKDDAAGSAYPDCTKEFNDAINSAIYLGTGEEVKVEGPFIDMNKSQIVALGTKLKVPYELTWSCYEGGDTPCGKCATCIDRAEAFAKNGLTDPLTEAPAVKVPKCT